MLLLFVVPIIRLPGFCAAVRFSYSFYLLCQLCHVGPRPLFVWSLSSTQTRTSQHTHTYSHRSVVSKHLDRVLLDEELEGCVDRAPNSDYLYLRQEVTRTQILSVEEKESNGNIETVAVARKSPSSKMLHIHSRPHQQCVPYFDTSIIVIIIIIIIHSGSSSSSSSRKKQ